MTHPPNFTNYVVGFLFDGEGYVLLIEKQRPDWQQGKLNGIGGHIENGESPKDAMRREFKEETGVDVEQWTHFATLEGELKTGAFRVYFFHATDWDAYHQARTRTDEIIVGTRIKELGDFPVHVLPNLHWLIPMAQYIKDDTAKSVVMIEVYGL